MPALKNFFRRMRSAAVLALAPWMVTVVAAQAHAAPGLQPSANVQASRPDAKPPGCGEANAAAQAGPTASYVLADSIGYGLHLTGLEKRLQDRLGGPSNISFDTGRSITSPGIQINKSALESVDIDRALIAKAGVIIIILGTNQMEASFADSQRLLVEKLKRVAPQAVYYWVDIGATVSTQVTGWSARNKVIYERAPELGYAVISRYRAIFGPNADPLNIKAGANFPGSVDEQGYGGPGNIHGGYPELAAAIIESLPRTVGKTAHCKL